MSKLKTFTVRYTTHGYGTIKAQNQEQAEKKFTDGDYEFEDDTIDDFEVHEVK